MSIKITPFKDFLCDRITNGEKHKIMTEKNIDTLLLVIYDERNHWEGGDPKTHMKKDYSEVAEA